MNTPVESAWLYHEIANCFLQLKLYEFSRDAAAKSLEAATTADSSLYQLQAGVLLAVSEGKDVTRIFLISVDSPSDETINRDSLVLLL